MNKTELIKPVAEAAGISQTLGVGAEKGNALHTVRPCNGGNDVSEFFDAIWCHKNTPLDSLNIP